MSWRKGKPAVNFKDKTGYRYGKLLVIKKSESKLGHTFWECLCDCGNTTVVNTSSLKENGGTKSCRCLSTEFNKKVSTRKIRSKNKLPNNEGGLNDIFRQYKDNAKNGKRIFELNREEFKLLIDSNCHYCNKVPSRDRWGYKYNGIDRIDSNKGYSLSNCLPSCFHCNKMKNNDTKSDFLNQIKLIYERHLK